MNILLTVAYDGTRYSGWQRQLNGASVQEELERALSLLYGGQVAVTGASRTDAGVHALCQCAAFRVPGNPYPLDKLPYIINVKLPADIAVTHARFVPESFNPRYAAKQKTYEYAIHNSPIRNPLCRMHSWHVWQPLDTGLMSQAAYFITGTHDFACFRAAGGHAKTSVRTVYSLSVAKERDDITVSVTGNGFLYKMVRNIVGTLVYVGMGKVKPGDIPSIIENGDRSLAGKTAPPQGLTLVEVVYDVSAFECLNSF